MKINGNWTERTCCDWMSCSFLDISDSSLTFWSERCWQFSWSEVSSRWIWTELDFSSSSCGRKDSIWLKFGARPLSRFGDTKFVRFEVNERLDRDTSDMTPSVVDMHDQWTKRQTLVFLIEQSKRWRSFPKLRHNLIFWFDNRELSGVKNHERSLFFFCQLKIWKRPVIEIRKGSNEITGKAIYFSEPGGRFEEIKNVSTEWKKKSGERNRESVHCPSFGTRESKKQTAFLKICWTRRLGKTFRKCSASSFPIWER